ncbi:MAG TPA: DinB family protein [Thermoanaerobaculia bacterium]|nr:DinB family protein [Thermoanaerobaculia bacterium]
MKLTDLYLAQLEREMVGSRKALERVPEGRPDWKPHPKSMPLGYLATLVATMPSWISMAIDQDALDLNPPGGGGYKPPAWSTTAELIAILDDSIAKAKASLARATDEHLLNTTWKLLVAGNVVMESPRHAVVEDTFTHLSHHRGQLTVYLRLNDAPVPSIYGPSADDKTF